MSALASSLPPADALTGDPADFLDAAFGHAGYVDGFPNVFAASNRHWRFGFENLAYCAAYPVDWHTAKTGFVRGLCLGSVATRPGHEGQGHASRAIDAALRAADERGIDAVFLFAQGAKAGLYEKAGFRKIGDDAFLYLHPEAHGAGAKHNARALRSRHADLRAKGFGKSRAYFECETRPLGGSHLAQRLWAAAVRLAEPSSSLLGWGEFQTLLGLSDMSVRWVEKRDAGIVALCFLGKGPDFDNVLHGLAGTSSSETLFLLGEAAQKDTDTTATLLLDGNARALGSGFEIARGGDVQIMVRARAEVEAWFRSGDLRIRGLHSC